MARNYGGLYDLSPDFDYYAAKAWGYFAAGVLRGYKKLASTRECDDVLAALILGLAKQIGEAMSAEILSTAMLFLLTAS